MSVITHGDKGALHSFFKIDLSMNKHNMVLLHEVKLQEKLFLSSRRLTLHSEQTQPNG